MAGIDKRRGNVVTGNTKSECGGSKTLKRKGARIAAAIAATLIAVVVFMPFAANTLSGALVNASGAGSVADRHGIIDEWLEGLFGGGDQTGEQGNDGAQTSDEHDADASSDPTRAGIIQNDITNADYGIEMNVFDYWLDGQDAIDYPSPSNYRNIGINANTIFKFGTGMGQTSDTDPDIMRQDHDIVNYWTEKDGGPRWDIVEPLLDDNGFPVLSREYLNGASLAYLFDDTSHSGKEAFFNVDGLLTLDDDGSLSYNARENYAYLDKSSNKFVIYDEPSVLTAGTHPDILGQFFPFNSFEETRPNGTNIGSTNAALNHYFGVHMTMPLLQTNNGVNVSTNSPVTYNFSGDDDVWLFIDGVLVGDLGGIHDECAMEIDFTDGSVYIYYDRNSNNHYDRNSDQLFRQTSIKEMYEKAGVADQYQWRGNTYANDTIHEVSFFYLERGNTDSNMQMKFNFVQPHLKFDKTVDTTDISGAVAGESQLEYTFTFRNESAVALDNVKVASDSLVEQTPGMSLDDIKYTWPDPSKPGHLESQQSATAKLVYTLTQDDIDRGSVTNTAHATAEINGGEIDNDEPDPIVTTDVSAVPGLSLMKEAHQTALDADETKVGARIDYSFVLENTGNITLDTLSITDRLDGVIASIDWSTDSDPTTPDGELAPGETVEATASYQVQQSDIDAEQVLNTAVAHAQTVGATPVQVPSNEDDAATALTQSPSISLTKTAYPDFVSADEAVEGKEITYRFEIANTGNVALSNAAVEDRLEGMSGLSYEWADGDGTIPAGKTVVAFATYRLTQADINAGHVDNTATASASDAKGNQVASEPASETVQIERTNALEIEKSADPSRISSDAAVPETRITYTFTVRNAGKTTLENVAIEDSMSAEDGLSAIEIDWNASSDAETPAGALSPNETVTATATYAITQADINDGFVENTAWATGDAPDGANVRSNDSKATTTIDNSPSISVVKTVAKDQYSGEDVYVDSPVAWTVVVSNDGPVSVKLDSFNDTLADDGNDGHTTIDGVDYSDPASETDGVLAPGWTATYSLTTLMTQEMINAGSIENEATVQASSVPDPEKTLGKSAKATTTITAMPSISLAKSVSPDEVAASDFHDGYELTYTLTATNTGKTTLHEVNITDSMLTPEELASAVWDWSDAANAGTLAPGESASVVVKHAVSVEEALEAKKASDGVLTNTARVDALDPSGENVNASASASATIGVDAAIELTKTVDKSELQPAEGVEGAVLGYTLTIRNASVSDIAFAGDDIEIIDEMLADAGKDATAAIDWSTKTPDDGARSLKRGESVQAYVEYELTQEDVEAGRIENTAKAVATPVAGNSDHNVESAPSTVDTVINRQPSISLVKSASENTIAGDETRVGKPITYSFKVSNDGPVAIYDIAIEDALPGLSEVSLNWEDAIENGTASESGRLLPDEYVMASAVYALTQSDIDAGKIDNTAHATANDGRGNEAQDDATASVDIIGAPGISLVKTGDALEGDGVKEGAVGTFGFAVTNTGNVTLSDVDIDDALIEEAGGDVVFDWTSSTDNSTDPGTLSPGETVQASADYELKQSDIDAGAVHNEASAKGTPLNGGGEVASHGEADLTVSAQSGISVKKTTTRASIAGDDLVVGAEIPYEIEIENTGATTLSDVVLEDELVEGTEGAAVIDWSTSTDENTVEGVLSPGEIVKATAAYPIQQPDMENGIVENEAHVFANPPYGAPVEDDAQATTVLASQPSLLLEKDASVDALAGDEAKKGATIDYTITITNNGDVALELTGVHDSLAYRDGEPAPGFEDFGVDWDTDTDKETGEGLLSPGESVAATARYTLSQSDIDSGANIVNTAYATAVRHSDPSEPEVVSNEDDATTTISPTPSISLVKSVSESWDADVPHSEGDVVEFSLVATNDGATTLHGVDIKEMLAGATVHDFDWSGSSIGEGSLAPGESVSAAATYALTQEDIDAGKIVNDAMADGTDELGAYVEAPGEIEVALASAPSISIEKTGPASLSAEDSAAGKKIPYTITIANTGNVTIDGIVASDPKIQSEPLTMDWASSTDPKTGEGVLAPGESVSADVEYELTQEDVDAALSGAKVENTAHASGSAPDGSGVGPVSDTVETELSGVKASIKIEKASDKEQITDAAVAVGTEILYDIVIINDGDATLSDVSLEDALIAGNSQEGADAVAIEWSTSSDPETGEGMLSPGETVRAKAMSYAISEGDILSGKVENTANASASAPDGSSVDAADKAETTIIAAPALAITKTVDETLLSEDAAYDGRILTYTFKVENTGNVKIEGIGIEDSLSGKGLSSIQFNWSGSSDAETAEGVLSPGETVPATATYAITQAQIDAGETIENAATAFGKYNGADVRSDEDKAITEISRESSVDLVKTASPGGAPVEGAVAGQTKITYTFTIENTGNTTLRDVAVQDMLDGLGEIRYDWENSTDRETGVGVLSPGEKVAASAEYMLKQPDIDAGNVLNSATVTATSDDGVSPSDKDETVTEITKAPSLSIQKEGPSEAITGENAVHGTVIDYRITVTNDGNATVSGITVSDDLVDSSVAETDRVELDWTTVANADGTPVEDAAEGVLAPGQSVVANASYTLTHEDIDGFVASGGEAGGVLENVARACGKDPDGGDVASPDGKEETQIVPVSSIQATKTADPSSLSGDDVKVDARIEYEITITNTGASTLTDVSLEDELVAGTDGAAAIDWSTDTNDDTGEGVLAAGESVKATASYAVKQNDIDAGEVINTAVAKAIDPSGAERSSEATATTTIEAQPSLSIVKNADAEKLEGGGIKADETKIAYSFKVRNTGAVTLNGVGIADPMIEGIVASGAGNAEAVVIDWGASSDAATGNGVLSPGETVSATASYTLTQKDINAGATIRNAAKAYGTPDGGVRIESDESIVETEIVPNPSMSITKSATGDAISDEGKVENAVANETKITYEFVVENIGNTTLEGVRIDDPKINVGELVYDWSSADGEGVLAPGQKATATGIYTLTQEDIDNGAVANTATAYGETPGDGGDDPEPPADTVTTEITRAPSLALDKTGPETLEASEAHAGKTIEYGFTVTNTGNVTLTGVDVSDWLVEQAGGGVVLAWEDDNADRALAPGESASGTASYKLTQTDIDNLAKGQPLVNEATATGFFGVQEIASAPDTVETDAQPESKLAISKIATPDRLDGDAAVAGAKISYEIVVRNDGATTLNGIDVADKLVADAGGDVSVEWDESTDGSTPAGTLAPGEEVRAYADYAITEEDIAAGRVVNEAAATGSDPAGVRVGPVSDDAETEIASAPALSIEKTTQQQSLSGDAVFVGSAIAYDFTVRNDGNLTVSGMSVEDALIEKAGGAVSIDWTSSDNADTGEGVLAPGESVKASASYKLTQNDIDDGDDIVNTATAKGTATGGIAVESAPSSATTALDNSPRISLDKKASADRLEGDAAKEGTEIEYTFTVTNIGPVALEDVELADTLTGEGLSEITIDWGEGAGHGAGLLPVGATAIGTATYALRQGDVDAGELLNTASVTARSAVDGKEASDRAEAKTTIERNGAVSLAKSGPDALDAAHAVPGARIDYSFTIQNTGNTTLSEVELADNLEGVRDVAIDWATSSDPATAERSLAPGEMVAASAWYPLAQDDIIAGAIENTASVAATSPEKDEPVHADARWTTSLAQSKSVSIEKTATPQHLSGDSSRIGAEISYSFVITNTGNIPLEGVGIDDEMLETAGSAISIEWGSSSDTDTDEGVMSPGETVRASASYTVLQGDIDAGAVNNTATAYGTPQGDAAPISSQPSSATTTMERIDGIEIEKSVDETSLDVDESVPGTMLGYSFVVRNTGNTTLTEVGINDSLAGSGLSGIAFAWGESSDAKTGEGTLAPNETVKASATYEIKQADIDAGSVVNEARAVAVKSDGNRIESEPALAETSMARTSSLSIDKSASTESIGATDAKPGTEIRYTVLVRNDGNTTVRDVSFEDVLTSPGMDSGRASWTAPALDWSTSSDPLTDEGVLSPGETVEAASASYALTQDDIDGFAKAIKNTATVSGKTDGGDVGPASDAAETTVTFNPHITIEKTATPESISEDDLANGDKEIEYSFLIRNDGSATLHDVSLEDEMLEEAGATAVLDWGASSDHATGEGVLSPGETVAATARYVATQLDIDAGFVKNAATVSAAAPNGDAVGDDDDARTDIAADAAITLEKSAQETTLAGDAAKEGAVVVWTFKATNTGSATLTDVSIEDELEGVSELQYDWSGSSAGEHALAPGEAVTATATYALTQSDIDAGFVKNAAKAMGTPQNGDTVSFEDEARVDIAASPALSIDKQAPETVSDAKANDEIAYTFVVSNNGNVTISGIAVQDELLENQGAEAVFEGGATTVSLAPGESATATAIYVLMQEDIDNGRVENAATATGKAPDGSDVPPASDTVTTGVRANGALTIEKTATPDSIGGDAAKPDAVIAYSFAIENTGDTTLSDVHVEDGLEGLGEIRYDWSGCEGDGVLAPGQRATASAEYRISQDDIEAGRVDNTATAVGAEKDGDAVRSEPDDASATIARSASVALSKSADTPKISGDDAHGGYATGWSFTVRNDGNVSLSDVAISDALAGVGEIVFDWDGSSDASTGEGELSPGETVDAHASYSLSQQDVDAGRVANSATATAFGAGIVVEDDATAEMIVEGEAGIALFKDVDKKALGSEAREGDVLTYSFRIENTGDKTLADVSIDDELSESGLSEIEYDWTHSEAERRLAPGESATATATYVLTQDDIDVGAVVNSAEASGVPEGGGDAVRASADATTTIDAAGRLVLSKDASATSMPDAEAGDEIEYTFTVTNVGNATVDGVSIDDDMQGLGDVEWDAEATEADGGAITESGTAVLSPGASAVAHAVYEVTQKDIDAGYIDNAAIVHGEDPDGDETIPGEDEVITELGADVELILDKSVDRETVDDAKAGDVLNYSFVVSNAGEASVSDIAIIDEMLERSGSDVTFDWASSTDPASGEGVLSPGESVVAHASYAVTEQDIANGSVENVAVAEGFGNGRGIESAEDKATTVLRAPDVRPPDEGDGEGTDIGDGDGGDGFFDEIGDKIDDIVDTVTGPDRDVDGDGVPENAVERVMAKTGDGGVAVLASAGALTALLSASAVVAARARRKRSGR